MIYVPAPAPRPRCAECGARMTIEEHRYFDCHCNWCEGWKCAWAFDNQPKPRMLWIRKFFNRCLRALLLTE